MSHDHAPPKDPLHFPHMPPGTLPLWSGILGAPAAWLLQLQATYAMVPWVCSTGRHPALYLTTLVFLLISLAGGLLSWRQWKRIGWGWPSATEPPPESRIRFLSVVGMLISALFSLIMIGQAIAFALINPCWD